jgi:polysaccharide export outer membrane protein
MTLRRFAVFVSMLCLLSACSLLPRSGPTKSSMMDAEAQRQNLAVVEIDPAIINLLSSKEKPSLFGAFGDYRPAPDPRINVGDELQVTLWESAGGGLFSNPSIDPLSAGSHSLVTPQQIVDRDGSITVPFAGRAPVVGKTSADVELEIRRRLTETAIDPQALVTVQRLSDSVTVISEGGRAARVPLSVRGDKLLEVIAQAGGIRTAASDISVVLSRGDRTVRVPLETVLRDPREDIYLRAGDVVTQVLDPQSFTAVGATGHNNVVRFGTPELSLDEALGKAGGLLDNLADPAGVFLIRFESGAVAEELARTHGLNLQRGDVPTIYHLNLREPTGFFLAKKFSMRNKDIIYVADSPFGDFQKVFGLVDQMLTPAFTGLLIQNSL